MGKKSRRENRTKQPIGTRTKEERQCEADKIFLMLEQLELTNEYSEIQELTTLVQTYINSGERIVVNIPFLEVNRKIEGVLATSKREKVWVKLTHQKN